MAIDTHKYGSRMGSEPRHSAFEEFSRDERRPAVLLLSALALAVLFFAIGLLVGRWTATPESQAGAAPSTTSPAQPDQPATQPDAAPSTNAAAPSNSPDPARRFTLLVATYDSAEKAEPLMKVLRDAGFADVRTTQPRAGAAGNRYSILAGRFTQDEAREAARKMRALGDPRLKNPRVIEER